MNKPTYIGDNHSTTNFHGNKREQTLQELPYSNTEKLEHQPDTNNNPPNEQPMFYRPPTEPPHPMARPVFNELPSPGGSNSMQAKRSRDGT